MGQVEQYSKPKLMDSFTKIYQANMQELTTLLSNLIMNFYFYLERQKIVQRNTYHVVPQETNKPSQKLQFLRMELEAPRRFPFTRPPANHIYLSILCSLRRYF